jgi:hypothetical protein
MSRYYRTYLEESGSAYTTRTTAFATATGITDVTILGALNTFDLGLISNSLDTKMYAVYPFVGGTATTQKYNFMNTSNYQITWSGGITHDSNGVLASINGIGQTNFNPTTVGVSQNSWSFGLYSRTNSTVQSFDMGSTTSPRSEIDLYVSGSYIVSNNGGFNFSSALSRTDGFFINSRITGANFQFYRNGTLFQSFADASTGINNSNLQVISATAYASSSDKQEAFAFLGQGLNSTEATTFYNLVQAMQVSLSRAV